MNLLKFFKKDKKLLKPITQIVKNSDLDFITIEAVKNAISENSFSEIIRLFELFESRDLKIAEGIEKRVNAIVSIKPIIKAGADEQKILDKLFKQTTLSEFLYALSSAIYYGYSLIELDFTIQDGLLLPNGLIHHAPSILNADDKNRLYIKSKDKKLLIDSLKPRLFFYQHTTRGDKIHNRALAYKILYYALLKHSCISLNVQYFDSLAIPPLIAKSQNLSDEDELLSLQSALMSLKSNSFALFSKEIDIDTLKVGTAADFQKLINYFDNLIAQYIVGATTISDGKSGSYALAKIQNERFLEKVSFDAARIEEGLEALLNSILSLNLNNFTPVKVTLPISKKSSPTEFATIVEKLYKAGYEVDEKDISKELGFKVTKQKTTQVLNKELNTKAVAKPLDIVSANIEQNDLQKAESSLLNRFIKTLNSCNSYEEAYAILAKDRDIDTVALEDLLSRYISNGVILGLSDGDS